MVSLRVVVLFLLVSLLIGGCGGSGRLAVPPVVKEDSIEAGGWPVLGSAPSGLTLRFIERGRFGVGLALHNRSHRRMTVVDVQTVDVLGSLIHQIGVRLVPWNPPACPGTRSCPALGFLRSPFNNARPLPLTVAPGKDVGAQLNYQLGDCAAVPLASFEPPRFLEIVYQVGEGKPQREQVALGSARLLLREPAASACDPIDESAHVGHASVPEP